MSSKYRERSIELRKQGYSINEISGMLPVAKGSVSAWVRNIVLTPRQRLHLKQKIHFPEVVEKRRQSRLKNESEKKRLILDKASQEISKMDARDLKIMGIGLYWGEGSKKTKGVARISNSDPAIIMMGMRFFREICNVPEKKFRAQIHIHSPQAVTEAEKYWSEVTRIPLSQFYKTYMIKSKSSKNVRQTLPYGTLDVGVSDTQLLLRILGWIEGMKKQLT